MSDEQLATEEAFLAWRRNHRAWLDATSERQAMHAQWVHCSTAYGFGSPSAIGCLLAMAREAWCDSNVSTSPDGCTWAVFVSGTELAAIVASILAAKLD